MKKCLSLLLVATLLTAFLPTQAAFPATATNATVEQTIGILLEQFGYNFSTGASTKVTDAAGRAPSAAYAAAVGYAKASGFLPASIPSFAGNASKDFALQFAMKISGYKSFNTTTVAKEKSLITEIINDVNNGVGKSVFGAVSSMGGTITGVQLVKLAGQFKNGNIALYAKSKFYTYYGKPDLAAALFICNFNAGAIVGKGTLAVYAADVHRSLGLTYQHSSNKMYYQARLAYQKCISLDPNGNIGKAARDLMAKLPANELDITYNTGAACSYQDFIALMFHHCSFATSTAAVNIKDSAGALPAAYAVPYITLAKQRNYYTSVPSWKAPATRAFIAEVYTKMRGMYDFNAVNSYQFSDARSYSPSVQLMMSLAVEQGIFSMDGRLNVSPTAGYTRGQVQPFLSRYLSEKRPLSPAPLTKRLSSDKLLNHTYYIHTDVDNGQRLIEKRAASLDFVTFMIDSVLPKADRYNPSQITVDEKTSLFISVLSFHYNQPIRDAIEACNKNGVVPLLSLSSYGEASTSFVTSILNDAAKTDIFVQDIMKIISAHNYGGVNLSEFLGLKLPKLTRANYNRFIIKLANALHAKNLILMVTTGEQHSDDPSLAQDFTTIGKYADYVHMIHYDNHNEGTFKKDGKEYGMSFLLNSTRNENYAFYFIPREKILFGTGSYAVNYNLSSIGKGNYGWSMTSAERVNLLKGKTVSYGVTNGAGEDAPYADYTASDGTKNRIRYETVSSFSNRMQFAKDTGMAGVSYYWLGSDNDDYYTALKAVTAKSYKEPISSAATWSHNAINTLLNKKMLPNFMQRNYSAGITRLEFAILISELMQKHSKLGIKQLAAQYGKKLDATKFVDSAHPAILLCNAFSIVNGVSSNRINPYGLITREEAAVMLTNLAKNYFKLNTSNAPAVKTLDVGKFSSWSKTSIAYVMSIKVMTPTVRNEFEYNKTFNRMMGFQTMYNMMRAMKLL